ncbi:MAG: methionyl-tRNA formyltransferase [Pseudomonadota bacterium]
MDRPPLRLVFMGTPDFAVPALQTLLNSDHKVLAVYTQPPRPKGRGKKLQASPVHELAESADIEVRTPENFKNHKTVHEFEKLEADLAIVAAYGLILPREILNAPKYGCVNIHASLLPRWRGAAPIHRAILAGDTKTGITLMQMDEGLDTGNIISMEKTIIGPKTRLDTLHDSLAEMGGSMLSTLLETLQETDTIESTPQPDDGVTYAHMLKKEEGRIDWHESADSIERKIRAFYPWPGTWNLVNDKRLKIIKAENSEQKIESDPGIITEEGIVNCGDGHALQLLEVQPENKKIMDIQAAMNGGYLKKGDMLT